MSKLYSIQESTLTDIGDALRSKYGETRPGTITVPVVIAKSSNVTDLTTVGPCVSGPEYVVARIPGATKIEVNLYYVTQTFAKIHVASGEYNSNMPQDNEYIGGIPSDWANAQIVFEDTEVITFCFTSIVSNLSGLGYYAECIGYDADGNPIEVEGCSYKEQEVEVKNTYSSAEVAAAIDGLDLAFEPIVLSNGAYACSGTLAHIIINRYGDKISTEDLYPANYMFYNSGLKHIPFEINCNTFIAGGAGSSMFSGCENLEEAPVINNLAYNSIDKMYNGCKKLRTIPEPTNWKWEYIHDNCSAMFNSCRSLRKIPQNILSNMRSGGGYYYQMYYNGFTQCYVLDEITDAEINTATFTSNFFSNSFTDCYRLKNLTFKMNEDGSPQIANWKSQTIDLNKVGYTTYGPDITGYNSGITADKSVNNAEQYESLKDDPDWYAIRIEYSRYNRTSAVATINSLPDTSAYLATAGGTNTIKFTGASGSATDGGAINTMTEEEIAVATAKGWTVSFT